MKHFKVYAASIGIYLLSSLVCVAGINMDGWNYRTYPIVATTALIVTGGACSVGGFAACAVAALADLLIVVASSWSKQANGQSGYAIDQAKRTGLQVFHDAGDGRIRDFLDYSVLKAGVEHPVWDSKGNVYTATKHATTGDNILSVHLNGRLENTSNGLRVNKRAIPKRDDADANLENFSASWNYQGSVFDDYSEAAAKDDAQVIYDDLFEAGVGAAKLKSSYDCSTLSPSNGDDEQVKISITPGGDGFPTEIEPACGAQ